MNRKLTVLVGFAMFTIACGGVDSPSKPIVTQSADNTAPANQEPAVKYDTPTKADFKITIKILSKQCFGSAGCNVEYRANLSYGGAGLDPDKTYEVTYVVKGADSPITDTFEITSGDQYNPDENYVSTPSSGAKLVATVTAVEET